MPGFLSDLVDEAKPPQPIDLRPALNKPASFFGGMLLEGEDNPNLRPESRMELTLAKQAQQQKPLDEAASAVREKYGTEVKVDPHAYELSKQRSYYSDKEPSLFEYGILRSTPFASSLGQFGMAKEYKEARDRSTAGTAQPDDAKTIARYERLQELDAKQSESSGGAARLALAHLPAMIGEAYLTAGVAGELRGARAAGVAAKGAEGEGAAGQLGLRGFASRSANTAGGRLVTGTGQNLAQTAAMPSMYLPQSAERAIEKGGDWSDVDNLGRSYAIANLQVAVLGRLGPAGDAIPAGGPGAFGTRLAVRTGTGMLEQQAADTMANAIGLQDRKGTLYEALNGQPGSLKNATTEAITFAAFSLMHGAPQPKGLKAKPLEIDPAKAKQAVDTVEQSMNDLKASGRTPQQVGETMADVHHRVDAALVADPTLTKGEARKLFANDPPEVQKFADIRISALPDKKIPIRDSSLGPREAVLKEMGRQKGNEALLKLAVDLVPEEGGSREHAQQVAAKLPEGNLKRYAEQLIEQHFGPEPAKSPEPAKAPVEPAKSTPLDTGWKLGSDLATRAESVLGPDWAREVKALGFDADAAALKSYLDQVEAKSTPVEAAVPAAKPAGQSVAAPTSAKGEFVSSSDLRAILGRHNDGVHDASVEVDKLIGDRIAKGYTIVHWYENKPEAVTYEPATRQFDQHGNPETGILREANGNRIGLLASITASPGEKAGIEFVPPASRPAAGRKLPAPKDAVKVHEPAGELFDRLPDASKARLAKKAGISVEAYRSHADTNPSIAERVRGEVETLKQMGKPIAPEAAKPSTVLKDAFDKIGAKGEFESLPNGDEIGIFPHGDRYVQVVHSPEHNFARIDFDYLDPTGGVRTGETKGPLQGGTKGLADKVKGLIEEFHKKGVMIAYAASEAKAGRGGSRTGIYEKYLERAGYKLSSVTDSPDGAKDYLWEPTAKPGKRAPYRPETAPEAPKPTDLPPQEPATAPKAEPASAVPEQKSVVPPADVTSKANTSAERVASGLNVPRSLTAREVADLLIEAKVAIRKAQDLLDRFSGETLEEIAKRRGVTSEAVRQSSEKAAAEAGIDNLGERLEKSWAEIRNANEVGIRDRQTGDPEGNSGGIAVEIGDFSHDPNDVPADKKSKQSARDKSDEKAANILFKLFSKGKISHDEYQRQWRDTLGIPEGSDVPVRRGKAGEDQGTPRVPGDVEGGNEQVPKGKGPETPAPTVAEQRTEGLTPEELAQAKALGMPAIEGPLNAEHIVIVRDVLAKEKVHEAEVAAMKRKGLKAPEKSGFLSGQVQGNFFGKGTRAPLPAKKGRTGSLVTGEMEAKANAEAQQARMEEMARTSKIADEDVKIGEEVKAAEQRIANREKENANRKPGQSLLDAIKELGGIRADSLNEYFGGKPTKAAILRDHPAFAEKDVVHGKPTAGHKGLRQKGATLEAMAKRLADDHHIPNPRPANPDGRRGEIGNDVEGQGKQHLVDVLVDWIEKGKESQLVDQKHYDEQHQVDANRQFVERMADPAERKREAESRVDREATGFDFGHNQDIFGRPVGEIETARSLLGDRKREGKLRLPISLTSLSGLKDFSWKKAFRRWVISGGEYVHPEIHEAKLRSNNRFNAYLTDVKNWTKDMMAAAKEYKKKGGYNRIDDAEVKLMNLALQNNAIAKLQVQQISPKLADLIEQGRLYKKGLSNELVQMGAARGELAVTIDANGDVYLNRAYQVFTDPKWYQKVPQDVKDRAMAWYHGEMLKLGQNLPHADLEAWVVKMLKNDTAADNIISFLASKRLGEKDLGIFKERKDVPKAYRELLGEIEDPIANETNTVYKQARMITDHAFQQEILAAGKDKFFFDKPTISPDGTEHVHTLNKQFTESDTGSLGGLANQHMTKELKHALESAYTPKQMSEFGKFYMKMVGITKYAKTVGNAPVGYIKNLLGNVGPIVRNGHWRIGYALESLKPFLRDTPDSRGKFRRLTELGVIGDGVREHDFKRDVQEVLAGKEDDMANRINQITDRQIVRAFKAGLRIPAKVYRLMDTIPKVYAYYNELADYKSVDPSKPLAQQEREAADRVRKLYPSNSMAPKIVDVSRRNPFAAPFPTFTAETIRNHIATLKLAFKELSRPETRHIGAKRLTGYLLSAGLTAGIGALSRWIAGVTSDEDEAMRRNMPPWSKHSVIVHLGKGADGKPLYMDIGSTDPDAYFFKIIREIGQGEPGGAFKEAAGPFALDPEILTTKLGEVAFNRDLQTDRPIRNTQAPTGDQAEKVGRHVGEAFKPGAVDTVQRLLKTEHPERELLQATGQRVQEVDTSKSMFFKGKDYSNARSEAHRIVNSAIKAPGPISDGSLAQEYQKTEAARRRLFEEMRQDVAAARLLKMEDSAITKVLGDAGMSQDDIRRIKSGEYKPYSPEVDSKDSPEIRRRKQLVRGLAK